MLATPVTHLAGLADLSRFLGQRLKIQPMAQINVDKNRMMEAPSRL